MVLSKHISLNGLMMILYRSLAGWPAVVGAIIIAILAFGAYSLIYILILLITKKYSAFTSALPFAPFLILGLIVIFYL